MGETEQPSFGYRLNDTEIRTHVRARSVPRSEQDSEGDAISEATSDEDNIDYGAGVSIEARLAQNKMYIQGKIESGNWKLQAQGDCTSSGSAIQLVTKPAASKIRHRALHPALYRNIQPLHSLQELADKIGAPSDWEQTYNDLMSDPVKASDILERLQDLVDTSHDTNEASISCEISNLIVCIGQYLGCSLRSNDQTSVIVGGILADESLDIKGNRDLVVKNKNGREIFKSEIKTEAEFPDTSPFYGDSRGTQLFCTMYGSQRATAAAVTPKKFKIFVENQDRNTVYTFPVDTNTALSALMNSSKMERMGRNFLRILVMCIIADSGFKRPRSAYQCTPVKPIPLPKNADSDRKKPDSSVPSSAEDNVVPMQALDAASVNNRSGFSDPRYESNANGNVVPQFVAGFGVDGQPIYVQVRVGTAELIRKVEAELELSDSDAEISDSASDDDWNIK